MSDVAQPGSTPHPVTVVVPVYGDLPSLLDCVNSLKQNVDQSVHRVLLVNDDGPEADLIETAVLSAIDGEPGFAYARNEVNLGFVGNCNRAVLERDASDNDILLLNSDTITTPGFIEELSAVLHSDPRHGAVCPRSNNATIASLPYKLRDPSVGRTIDRTAAVHQAVKELLPRFSVAPVAMGFCILMRRELIAEYGLFDEVFAPGYGEENDFCLRIGSHGYVSLIAHHALVFHAGGKSFIGARRESLRSSHEGILVERYPHYPAAVRTYLDLGRDPVDVFADAIAPAGDVARVLVDLDDELDRQAFELLDGLAVIDRAEAIITVSAPDALAARLTRRYPTLKVVRRSRLDGLWDLGIALGAETMSDDQQFRLNRAALRWATVDDRAVPYIDARVSSLDSDILQSLRALIAQIREGRVDVALLRDRWDDVTRRPGYMDRASSVREARHIRAIRALERRAPAAIGWLKGATRRVIRRD